MNAQPRVRVDEGVTEKARPFGRYDGRRFAIVLPRFCPKPLRGIAHRDRDELLGNVLRISIESDSPGEQEIVIAENDWNGLIIEDTQYGCDFCVVLVAAGS